MNFNCELPFSFLSNLEILSLYEVTVLDFASYCNKTFDPNDRCYEDMRFNTDLTHSNYELNCNYFNIGSELEKYMKNKSLNHIQRLYMNIGSIPKRLIEIQTEIKVTNLDVLAFFETRLSEDIENLYKLENYVMFSNSRNTRGGGVSIYIRSIFSSQVVKQFSIMEPYMETIFVKFTYREIKYLFGIVYRPPSSSTRDFLDNYSNMLEDIGNQFGDYQVCIGGDYNLDLNHVRII